MTNEEILLIVKLKYPNAKLLSYEVIVLDYIMYTERNYTCNGEKKKAVYIKDNKIIHSIIFDGEEYVSKIDYEFKNAIKLKHLLNLEIIRQDIVII